MQSIGASIARRAPRWFFFLAALFVTAAIVSSADAREQTTGVRDDADQAVRKLFTGDNI